MPNRENVAEKLANWHDLRHILRRINKTIPHGMATIYIKKKITDN